MEDQAAAKEGPGALDPLTPTMAREIQLWPLAELEPYERNARTHSPEQVQQIAASIMEFGFVNPVLVARGTIRAGHGRVEAAKLLGLEEVPVVKLDHLTEEQARAFTLADNRLAELAGWDDELLAAELAELAAAGTDLAVLGFSDTELAELAADLEDPKPPAAGSEREPKVRPEDARGVLARRFGVPPFSVLDSKQGYWQERKAAWLALGIRSEVGRDSNLLGMSETVLSKAAGGDPAATPGTSIFDPVLCELAYRWWCPEGGRILDPFAGGSVRGIVAAHLGFTYCGIELREEQVRANEEQAERILGAGWELKVQWICGDSLKIAELLEGAPPFDFLFTCPPYYDLEKYSSSPEDLSNAPTYAEFLESYRAIFAAAVGLLADGRFACVVVSDLRPGPGRTGNLLGFEKDTQQALEDAGAGLYNLAVLTQPVGALPIRAGRIFGAGRKLPRNHQAVQVFAKGDAAGITRELLGPTEWDTIESNDGAGLAELGLEPLVLEGAAPELPAPADQEPELVEVVVSSKQARQLFHGCDPGYIASTCHAACCHSSKSPTGTLVAVLPEERAPLEARGAVIEESGLIVPRAGEKQCPFEADDHLCELHGTGEKPSGCIASPFTLGKGKNPKLLVANRYRLLGCYKDGENPIPAYIAFRASLDLLLGDAEAERLAQHLDDGGGDLPVMMPRARWDGLRFKAAVSRAGKAKE